MKVLVWLLPLVLGSSYVLTRMFRSYALSRKMLDVPNARSSHTVPTPRGGGLAIAISFLGAVAGLAIAQLIDLSLAIAICGSGLLVVVIGLIDDRGHVPARWRLLGHFVAAAWVLGWLGGLPPIPLLGMTVDRSIVASTLAAVAIVWLLNLYNFMDGIDGIAGVEAMTVLVAGAAIYFFIGHPGAAILPLVLAGATAGFLIWNFPPARIFMGDAGSGFLGLTLGTLALQGTWIKPELSWSWMVLLGVFIVDASYTVIQRLLRGEKVYEAHRSHAYQQASRQFGSHKVVTLGVAVTNVCWLFPIAALIAMGMLEGVVGLALAYVPLLFMAAYMKAGNRAAQERVQDS
ncbi:glycosyltransferase family 4 protein [Proteobacteria bacterium 005FR1]|nr:glycosyltransferase family 4 protein [Proteobacteria bacterium 005FR1]